MPARVSRLLVLLPVLLTSIGCDQLTKAVAVHALRGEPDVKLAGGLVRFVYAENPGAFLGLFGDLSADVRAALLIAGVALVLLIASTLLWLWRDRLPTLALVGGALLVGGGLSNLLDRVWRDGVVVDFLQLGHAPLATGVFNVADVLLLLGAGLLALKGGARPGSPAAPRSSPAAP
jgi:signal peptidase II